MKRNFFSEPKYQGLLFFAAGIACFLLAGSLVFLFSGKFADRPSGAKAGPALSLSVPKENRDGKPVEKTLPDPPAPPRVEEWVLYITGAVVSPGVYRLPPDIRVHHLVDAAGGLLPNADPVQVNLAAPLADGVHVHVPAAAGVQEQKDPPSQAPQSPGQGFIRTPGTFSPAGSQGDTGSPVNINRASLEELQRLPGIGPATARAILEYRAASGSFSTITDLVKVKGIGPKKLEAIRDHITLR